MVRTIIEYNTAIIHIEKNIVSENVNILLDKMNALKEHGIRNYIFEFHNTEYMCSSALGIIAQTLRLSGETSGKVFFCSLSAPLKSLFEATKFLSIVSQAENAEEALKQCQ